MTAKLFIDGDERELHYVDMDYNRITSFIGWPVSEIFGGLIHLRFTPRGDEDFFLNWMFAQRDLEYPRCLYTFKNGEVVFYEGDVTEDIFFKYRFADCILISYKETFSNQWGMETEMVLSPAIQYYNHKSKYPFLKRWNESYIPPSEQTPYQAMEHEPEIDLKFIARFKRMDSYKGEFGFDWMRDDYLDNEDGTKGICENQVALKKEYTPTKIHEQDYFVPWLSMFPKQEGVKLKLSIKEIEGTRKASDIIKLSSKNGIKFVPDELKVSEANGKEITILCESPLSNDTKINLLDKNDNTVGTINIFKNDVSYNLNVKVIKVVREQSKERDLIGINEALQQVDLENYLNKNSLNQALIKTNIENNDTNVIELDTEQLTKDKKLDGAGFTEGEEQVSSMFLEDYLQKYEQKSTFKGLLVFVTIIRKPGSAGDGQLWIGDARNCSVFYDGLFQSSTYAHEIAHVLGCTHSFGIKEKVKGTIAEVKEAIAINKEKVLENESKIPKYEEKILKAEKGIVEMEKYPNNAKAIANIKIHKGNIVSHKKNIKILKKNIETLNNRIDIDEKKLSEFNLVTNSNQHIFPTRGSTKENFMDYTIPRSARISFWKWQWKAMQVDIKLYYSK